MEAQRQRAKHEERNRILLELSARQRTQPATPSRYSIVSETKRQSNFTRSHLTEPQVSDSQILKVCALFSPSENLQKHWLFEVHKTRKGEDCIKKVVGWLRTEFAFSGDESKVLITYKKDDDSWAKLEESAVLSEVFSSNEAQLKITICKAGDS